jgi:integral membrane protein
MSGALTRFRVMAYLVGCFLLLLTAGVVLRYGFGEPELSRTVSPIHGFLFMVYLVTVFDLGRRAAWPIRRMVLVMLAGTIPFLSFYAERVASRRWVPRTGDDPATLSASGP